MRRLLLLVAIVVAGLSGPADAAPTLSFRPASVGCQLVVNPQFICHTGSGATLCFTGWQGRCGCGAPICLCSGPIGCSSSATATDGAGGLKLSACVCAKVNGATGGVSATLCVQQTIQVCPCVTYHVVAKTCAPLVTPPCACPCISACWQSGCFCMGAEASLRVTFGGIAQCFTVLDCACNCHPHGAILVCGTDPFCFCVTAPCGPCSDHVFFCCPSTHHLATLVMVNESAQAGGSLANGFAFARIDPTIFVFGPAVGAPEIQGAAAVVPTLAVLGLLVIVADRRRRSGQGR